MEEEPKKLNIVCIGAGNVAVHLAKALYRSGCRILQVYSRTEQSARTLADAVQADYTNRLDGLNATADLYVVALTDDALVRHLPEITAGKQEGLFVHTSGSIPAGMWKGHAARYGVLYPLQTFSKQCEPDFATIPFFIEAARREDAELLKGLAATLSTRVYEADSSTRAALHLAAVLACNFTNRMYALAADVLAKHQLSFDLLLPLIDETARKVHQLTPQAAQTGPAVRYDERIVDKHLSAPELTADVREIYRLITQNIYKQYSNHTKTMSSINYDLTKIKALAFDVDGVLSADIMPLHPSGEPMRTVNIKDGYALRMAVKQGLHVAVITGGRTEAVRKRYDSLDITDIYMGACVKVRDYRHFRDKYSLTDEEILYMGDDIPDIEILRICGLPCCPKDAAPEVKEIARYISSCEGGRGCVREVTEQVLKAQGKWMLADAFGW